MKKLILYTFFALAATFAANAQTQPQVENKNQADIKFEEEKYDFGNVKEGELATHLFKFKNTGKEPLILTNVSASCGCTTPEWPKEPIAPGKSSTIDVRYDTNRPGAFTKTVTLTSNEEGKTKVLTIKGMVKTKPQPESAPAIQNSPLGAPQKSNVKG